MPGIEQPERAPQRLPNSVGVAPSIYIKTFTLREKGDAEVIKHEVLSGNVVIVRITPLAASCVEDVRVVVEELCRFSERYGGDIARLGEERVVITPPTVKIWRRPQSRDV